MIKFLDLHKINAQYNTELKEAFNRVIDSGWYILGKEITNFEKEFASYCGTEFCIGVANGLDALELIFNSLDLPKGSEVIVPAGNIQKTISTGGSVYTIASTSTDSYIYKLTPTGAISSTVTLTGIANGKNLESDGAKLFFSSGAKVYSMDLTSTAVPTSPILTLSDNSWSALYGFNVIDGKIYIGNGQKNIIEVINALK